MMMDWVWMQVKRKFWEGVCWLRGHIVGPRFELFRPSLDNLQLVGYRVHECRRCRRVW